MMTSQPRSKERREDDELKSWMVKLVRREDAMNRCVSPQFKEILQFYSRILPTYLVPTDEAGEQFPLTELACDNARFGGLMRLLALSCRHIKQGLGADAMQILDDATTLLQEKGGLDEESLAVGWRVLTHIRLKAKAAQGMLPLYLDMMKDLLGKPGRISVMDRPATSLCFLYVAFIRGAERLALRASRPVLFGAQTTYFVRYPFLPEDIRMGFRQDINRSYKTSQALARDAARGRTEKKSYWFDVPEFDKPLDALFAERPDLSRP